MSQWMCLPLSEVSVVSYLEHLKLSIPNHKSTAIELSLELISKDSN